MSFQALCIILQPSVNLNLSYSPKTFKSGRNWQFFAPCDLDILWMTLKNNRAPLIYRFKLCASFHSHWCVWIWVTVRKPSNSVKFDDFLPPVTLKFYGWHWKTIGHLFYYNSCFMHHLVAIGGFISEIKSRNAQVGSNLRIFCPRDPEILRMTLKNNMAPLLYQCKLCASFHSHWCV